MMVEIPAWLDAEIWAEFLRARKLLKKPMTDFAQKLAFKRLDAIRKAGHNPNASVEQSILQGWQGLFEPRDDAIKSASQSDYERTQQRNHAEVKRAQGIDSEDLRANAILAREKALAIKRARLPH